ncbi:MAG: alpha/beta fold hydrolase, partial [Granulosicoccaceae bacterium]
AGRMIPLVLLPGMMCTAELFSHQVAHFSRERAVHCAPISEHQDMTSLAKAVLRDAPPEFAVAGLSMGGIVAMEVQRLAPERVKGVALLDTNPFAELDSVKQTRYPQIVKVREGGLLAVMRDEMKPNYLANTDSRDDILELCAHMALQLGRDVFIRQSIALRDRPDQAETIRAIRVPSLVLCGDQDRLCPPDRHRMMQKMIRGSTLAIVIDAGHLPVLEQPHETNRHLQAWLRACDERLAHLR